MSYSFKSNDRRSTYRLFLSHSWSYDDEYERMVDLLNEKSNFSWDNYSVPEKDKVNATTTAGLKRVLKNKQIKPATVVVILSGMYAEHSTWIKREVRIANELDKQILAVKPHGNTRIPIYIRNRADKTVNWSTNSVVRAIRDLA
ncbi:TIR domain-containing protein [Halalkalicoccus tibetensis]|uniref:TIR domain-containing protein n=1 Tax=Halalkalicoccus tibetensis TaxID=175632 RepID=A0ABD5V9K8_9EURY